MGRASVVVFVVFGLVLSGCESRPEKVPGNPVPAENQQARNEGYDAAVSVSMVAAFDCEDGSYVVAEFRETNGDVVLFLPGETVFLPHVEAASGARYADDSTVFWTKGFEAVLERDGVGVDCVKNGPASVIEKAKLGGADFWATGNEPGWTLELFSDRLVLVTNYGELRIEAPVEPPVVDDAAGTAVFSSAGAEYEVTVMLRSGRCNDDMSGHEFETTVELVLDGRTYRGCGQALH